MSPDLLMLTALVPAADVMLSDGRVDGLSEQMWSFAELKQLRGVNLPTTK
jgi:hypothetical protein